MTLRTFAIFIYIFFATKQVCHLCRCTDTAAPFSPVSTFFLSCLHLLHAPFPPLLYFATAPFLPALSPFSCPHCDVNNSCFCRTRPASARKTSLYGGRQQRCRRPSHPAYGGRRTLSVTCTNADNGHTNAATIHRKPPALIRCTASNIFDNYPQLLKTGRYTILFTTSNIFDNYPPPHATENSIKSPFCTFLHKKANIPHRRFILFAYLCTRYCACGGTGRRARLRI